MKREIVSSEGIGFFGLLTILFIGLKLAGVIDWSWWLVFGPLWMPWAVLLGIPFVIGAVLAILGLVAVCIEWVTRKK